MAAGLLDEAEALYRAMRRCFPRHPGGLVGLAQVAMRRKDWPEALARWDSVLQSFGGVRNGFWHSARGSVLFELGRRQEAEAAHAGLIREFPHEPAGYAGLAQLALRGQNWPEALKRCDELLAKFADQPGADGWKTMRAHALVELGRMAEAEAVLKPIVDAAPGLEYPLLALLRVYVQTGRAEAAWNALNASPLARNESPSLMERRLDLMIRLNRRGEARTLCEDRIGKARDAETLAGLFHLVPALYAPGDRPRIWRALLARLTESQAILEARIQLALRNRDGVLAATRRLAAAGYVGPEAEALRGVAAALSDPAHPDYAKPKIFGIGLSRTGTTTLAAALSMLGFATMHWQNPLTCEVICDDDFPLLDAFTDTPVSLKFEKLYARFPNSKFIFTTRDFADWLRSMQGLWQRQLGISDFDKIKGLLDEARHGAEYCRINRSLYFDHANPREAFDAYERRVRRFFEDKPSGRFLEFDIFAGDGWQKLCAFVGRDVPAAPFPWENRRPNTV
jgi:tetratricopeptide (TPR) repeat protein